MISNETSSSFRIVLFISADKISFVFYLSNDELFFGAQYIYANFACDILWR